MNIPAQLIDQVKQGRIVLFFGAGASIGATKADGAAPPIGNQLRDQLCDKFYGGKRKDRSLAWVTELAISQVGLVKVQEFVAEKFRGLSPADFHLILPTFKWRAIVTTNYDRVVEDSYLKAEKPVQEVVPFISNRDQVDEKLRPLNSVGLLKLHGCITRTHDPELPLILTAEQYVTHREGRSHLFGLFEIWAYQYPVVFIGHSMQDSDLRAVLMEVSKEPEMRPRYYLIAPDADEDEINFWGTKNIVVIPGTLEAFLRGLDRIVPTAIRPLMASVDNDHPIKKHFRVAEDITTALQQFLSVDVDYVHEGLPVEIVRAEKFYQGFGLGWAPILGELDVRRRLTDTLLNDVIIRPEEDRPTTVEFYLIKAEAGAGKSVLLRRVAWEAARDADSLCLFAKDYGHIDYDSIRETHRLTQQRIFLFVDNAVDNSYLIRDLIENAKRDKIPLTVISAVRSNEWNMGGEILLSYLSEDFPLRYLNHTEIEALVTLLEKHNSLGSYLSTKSFPDRVKEFEERAGRQLLVALHEATTGLPFEEILLNEFNEIQPQIARDLYLTVCVLNRLNVPVRAGLIARVHKIPFDRFQEELFFPLEHVVSAQMHTPSGDYMYAARHPEIAQIIFERVLKSPEDRYSEYIRILGELNIAFSSDRNSYRGLIRARSLHELFPEHQDVKEIFKIASKIGAKEAYLYQQMANYERIRPNGNLDEAYQLLGKAKELAPYDSSIVHTLAELARTQAQSSDQILVRTRYRAEAKRLLTDLIQSGESEVYARTTLIKLAVDNLEDFVNDDKSTDRQLDDAIRAIEGPIREALQRDPGNTFLHSEEVRFGQLINDHDRVFESLKRAFKANPRDPYIATRLSKIYEEKDNWDAAKETLRKALEGKRGDKLLNFSYSMALRNDANPDHATIIYHLRRSFTKWDTNYEAQFWLARYLFESLDFAIRTESHDIFRRLRDIRMSHAARVVSRDCILENVQPKVFYGTIKRKETTHGFVERDGLGDRIFFHHDLNADVWKQLVERDRVSFNISFSFAGVMAIEITPL